MKARTLILAAALSLCAGAHATLYSSSTLNATIPDADPNGYANQITVSGANPIITGVTVRLNVTGGYNGDLYAYLSYNGTLVPLLNRVGTGGGDSFGYGDTGFGPDASSNPFRLSDSGAYDVHNYQDHSPVFNGSGQLTGTWRPDGGSLASFNGMNPNGNWTIFFADLSGGEQSTLVGWSLELDTVIPEPVNYALGIFGVIALTSGLQRALRQRKAA